MNFFKLIPIVFVLMTFSLIDVYAYDYDVSGYGDGGSVSGSVETYGQSVEGTLVTEDGETVNFEGEFTGRGEIEGYGDDGNYYELEVD